MGVVGRRYRWWMPPLASVIFLAALFLFQGIVAWNCQHSYDLLNPQWRCGETPPLKREYEAFKDELVLLLEDLRKTQGVEVALYFRDLQSGPWFGIGEETEFYPASLSKLPTMLTLLKIAERTPDVLQKKIGLEEAPPVVASVNPSDSAKTLIVGEVYTVDEVLRRSIVYSDNYSDFLLKVFIADVTGSQDFLLKAFKELGMLHVDEKTFTLSVKEYSSIFRILYNRQFLDRELSQKALNLLAQSDFLAGLKADLPPDVRVAHKFGYFVGDKAKKELLQMHDCGIIYHPQAPYTLCIMTRGSDLSVMTGTIADISKLVYDEVTSHASLGSL